MTANISNNHSAEEWNHLRKRFKTSILKTTEIAELGRSVGISWPFKGSDETPEKYIKFNFNELQNVPGLIGKKKRISDLMRILQEILAFDEPFSTMVEVVEKQGRMDQISKRVLQKLEIPENYPVNLMYFSHSTKELLYANGLKTLLEAINFSQKIVMESKYNELHTFINSLELNNQTTICKHLPFRSGQSGLHLPEAIGLLVRNLDISVKDELLHLHDLQLESPNKAKRKTASSSLKVALIRFNELCIWFEKQAAELEQKCTSRESIERYFLAINDAEIERISIALALTYFGSSQKAGEKDNLFGKLSRLFGR